MDGYRPIYVEDIQAMSMAEYAKLRNELFMGNYNLLWGNESYEYYLEKFVETGDPIYMDRMLEKVTEES